MLNIKSLTTAVAAAALVSAIGLAYAQTSTYPPATSDTAPATTTVMPGETAATTSPGTTSTPTSTPSTNANDALTGNVTEPAPRADRN